MRGSLQELYGTTGEMYSASPMVGVLTFDTDRAGGARAKFNGDDWIGSSTLELAQVVNIIDNKITIIGRPLGQPTRSQTWIFTTGGKK